MANKGQQFKKYNLDFKNKILQTYLLLTLTFLQYDLIVRRNCFHCYMQLIQVHLIKLK